MSQNIEIFDFTFIFSELIVILFAVQVIFKHTLYLDSIQHFGLIVTIKL